MPTCAILTIKDLSHFECYDHLLINSMKKYGWDCKLVPWDILNISWNDFDLAIIRSTWDYQDRIKEFLKVLHNIHTSNCVLQNSLDLVKWNIDKSYLLELSKKDIEIIPSFFLKNYDEQNIQKYFSYFSNEKLIIKPTISANADDTHILTKQGFSNSTSFLSNLFSKRGFIVQPFIKNIKEEGEFSLIFFGEHYSHTLLKTPKKSDFRVQEEHGGILRLIENPEKKLLKIAETIIGSLPFNNLYARVDLVRSKDTFLLMEVELIEPSLYFNLAPEASATLAKIISEKF